MRLGYYVPAQLHSHSGISARVAMTMRAWERLGVPSTLVTGPAVTPGSRRAALGLSHLAADRAAAAQMRALAARWHVVSAQDVLDAVGGGAPLPPRAVLVTRCAYFCPRAAFSPATSTGQLVSVGYGVNRCPTPATSSTNPRAITGMFESTSLT